MKKIMIACVAVAMAAVAQAASIDWQFTETATNSKNPVDLSGYTAYLFTENAWNAFTTGDQTLADFTGYSASASITSTAQGTTRTKFATGVQTTEGASGNYFVVLANNEGFVASSALAATAYTSATEQHTSAAWGISASADPLTSSSFTAFNTASQPDTPTTDVPEPTSGLLLLVGAAALALKRKVA